MNQIDNNNYILLRVLMICLPWLCVSFERGGVVERDGMGCVVWCGEEYHLKLFLLLA